MFRYICAASIAFLALSMSAHADNKATASQLKKDGWYFIECADDMFKAFVSFKCSRPDVIKMTSNADAKTSRKKGREMLECLQKAFEVERLTCVAAQTPVETFLIQAHDRTGEKFWEFQYQAQQ